MSRSSDNLELDESDLFSTLCVCIFAGAPLGSSLDEIEAP